MELRHLLCSLAEAKELHVSYRTSRGDASLASRLGGCMEAVNTGNNGSGDSFTGSSGIRFH